MTATAAEIASIRRRYLWMASSAAAIDFVFTLVFLALNDARSIAPRSLTAGLLLMLGVNLLLAHRLFEPIHLFLQERRSFEDIQRRLTQLPLLTAANVGILSALVTVFRLSISYFFNDSKVPQPTVADFAALCIVLPVFYFTYAYFAISDYL